MRVLFCALLFIFSLSFSQIISYELVKSWTISEVEQMYNTNSLPSNVGNINFEVVWL